MDLWNGKIPYSDEKTEFVPYITEYIAEGSKGAVVVCPGGGYGMRAEHEGKGYAKWLNSIGITAFVLEYRVAPYKHPAEISDCVRAVRYARFYAEKYGYSADKIAVMGSSAGAHLAGSLAVHYDKKFYDETDAIDKTDCRPDAVILCYPVIDMFEYRHDGSRQNLLGENPSHKMKEFMSLHMHVNENTPPAFIWHTSTDSAVPVENSLLYAEALSRVQIPFEMHIYPMGHHGLGLSEELPYVGKWSNDCEAWLKMMGF